MSRATPACARRRDLEVVVALAVLAGTLSPARATAAEAQPVMAYHTIAVRGPGTMAALRARVDSVSLDEVLRLNRVDLDHVRALDSLVVPEPAQGFRFVSPFPARVEAFAGQPKQLVVSVRVQAFAAYDSGSLVRFRPTPWPTT